MAPMTAGGEVRYLISTAVGAVVLLPKLARTCHFAVMERTGGKDGAYGKRGVGLLPLARRAGGLLLMKTTSAH